MPDPAGHPALSLEHAAALRQSQPLLFSLEADPNQHEYAVQVYLSILGWSEEPAVSWRIPKGEVVTTERMQRGLSILRAAREEGKGLFFEQYDRDALATHPKYPFLQPAAALEQHILGSLCGVSGPYSRECLVLGNVVLPLPSGPGCRDVAEVAGIYSWAHPVFVVEKEVRIQRAEIQSQWDHEPPSEDADFEDPGSYTDAQVDEWVQDAIESFMVGYHALERAQ